MEHQSTDARSDVEEKTVTNSFIISWDMTGLEAIADISQDLINGELWEKENLFERIKNPEGDFQNEHVRKVTSIIQMMTLRARANSQRHYEVYCLHTNASITKESLEKYFETNPQSTVELIRERGTKLYSDRINKKVQVIT